MSIPPPSHQEQIRFLQQLQRILADGSFVATYKFALLHALADLSVIHGEDHRGELRIPTRKIAEQVIELYWRQAKPFPVSARHPVVLKQSTGSQAKIVNQLVREIENGASSLVHLRSRGREWKRLVSRVEKVIVEMPLWKLQTVGPDRLDCLYDNLDSSGVTEITLKPGIAYCFRAFHELILDLIRGSWVRFIRVQNGAILGDVADLPTFLFGAERSDLGVFRPLLLEVQSGKCFYCGRALGSGSHVDHFVPWSRYPVDLGHNFVLTHPTCNGNKSDYLAAEPHLRNWLDRNERFGAAMSAEFHRIDVVHDVAASTEIARWAYGRNDRLGDRVWVQGRTMVPLTDGWEGLFATHTISSD